MNRIPEFQMLHPISIQEAYKRITLNLALPMLVSNGQNQLNPKAIMPETIRVSLWALAGATRLERPEPVYVTRFMNAARRLIPMKASMDKEDDDKITQGLRDTLLELELIGDVAPLQGGYWLPSPLRFVPLLNVNRWLIVGGVPSYLIPTPARDKLEFSGAARLLASDPSSLGLPPYTQSLEEWCRRPSESIDTWTSNLIQNKKLSPFEDSDQKLEFYAPGIRKVPSSTENLQYFRWTNQIRLLPDERYLSQYKSSFGPIFYSVAQIQNKQVVATAPIELSDGGVRRLMYGLDLIAGHSVTVKVNPSKKDKLIYTLNNELPGPENRIFFTLGLLQDNPTGKYYPRSWEIKKSFKAEADAALIGLGVKLV